MVTEKTKLALKFPFREYYEKTISEQEQLAKKLRQDKISVGESHNDHIEQRSMFVNLRMIMDLKYACLSFSLVSTFANSFFVLSFTHTTLTSFSCHVHSKHRHTHALQVEFARRKEEAAA